MKSRGFFIYLVFLFGSLFANAGEPQSLLPLASVPANATLTLVPVTAANGATYFIPNYNGTNANFTNVSNSSLYSVSSISNAAYTAAEEAKLQALMQNTQLLIQQSELTTAKCNSSGAGLSCTTTQPAVLMKSGAYDFMKLYGQAFRMNESPKQPLETATASAEKKPSHDEAMVEVMNRATERLNKTQDNLSAEDCVKEAPKLLKDDALKSCGLQQALDAFKKAKSQGKVKKDIFVFNDFADGDVSGKMWLLNSDGTEAKVLERNPIPVSRGEGGFGNGAGSLRTPNGAILTKEYRPPRAGNIRDGIELIGLESENQDIHKRGILLHGWDPYAPTQGCLGVPGAIDTGTKGKRTLGGVPPYLDILKTELLKDGGVMIYNFTPKKASLCRK